jgi:hypothetical protein
LRKIWSVRDTVHSGNPVAGTRVEEELNMGLSDDQRDDALKALRGAEDVLESLIKGVRGLEEASTLRARIEELEVYIRRLKMALKFV